MNHGLSMYSNGLCRCPVCREAHRVYRAAHRAKQRARRPPKPEVTQRAREPKTIRLSARERQKPQSQHPWRAGLWLK